MNWRIWRSGEDLFHLVDVQDYQAHAARTRGATRANVAWQERMADLLAVQDDYSGNERGISREGTMGAAMSGCTSRPAGLRCSRHRKSLPGSGRLRRPATVVAAWDAGIRYFDTAPHYGLGLVRAENGPVLRENPGKNSSSPRRSGRLLVPADNPSGGHGTMKASTYPQTCGASGTLPRPASGGAWRIPRPAGPGPRGRPVPSRSRCLRSGGRHLPGASCAGEASRRRPGQGHRRRIQLRVMPSWNVCGGPSWTW